MLSGIAFFFLFCMSCTIPSPTTLSTRLNLLRRNKTLFASHYVRNSLRRIRLELMLYDHAFPSNAVFTCGGIGIANSRPVPQSTRRNFSLPISGRSTSSSSPIWGSSSLSMLLAFNSLRIRVQPRISQAARRCSMFFQVIAIWGVKNWEFVIHSAGTWIPCQA